MLKTIDNLTGLPYNHLEKKEVTFMRKPVMFLLTLLLTITLFPTQQRIEALDVGQSASAAEYFVNSDFSLTENVVPMDESNKTSNKDIGFWSNDLKPQGWMFERYSSSSLDRSQYKADLDQGVMTASSNSQYQTPMSFFKPEKKIKAKPNTTYIVKGSYKTDFKIIANGKPAVVNLNIDQYNQNTLIKPSIEFELPAATTWTDFEHEFKIESATDFLPVFKFAFIKGSYSIKNISLKEKEIASDIKLTDLNVVQDEMTLAPQAQAVIKPVVEPSDYPVDRLEWSSSDLDVATVDAQGVVTAVAEGLSVITVSDSKSGLSKNINVNVRAPKDTNLFAKNILENGSFEKLVKAPNKGNTSAGNWHQDVGFWDQDLKPESWVFERYKSSNLDASYYSAEMVKSDVKDGSYAAKINLERNDQSALSFFKPQKRYDVKPETTYVYEGWFKSENLETLNSAQARINLQVDGYAANKFSGVVHADTINASDPWTRFKVEFKTDDQTTQILPVFRMHNTKGSYFLDDLMLYEKPIGATSIQLNDDALDIALNQKVLLPVVTEPSAINQKTLEWSSSDESIVRVDQGSIVGLKPGIAKIRVSSAFDPSIYDEMTVTVLNTNSLPIQSISVVSDSIQLDENQLHYLEFEMTPMHANYKDLSFVSKNKSVVDVTEEGLLLPQKQGVTEVQILFGNNVLKTINVEITASQKNADMQSMIHQWQKRYIGDSNISSSLKDSFKDKVIREGESLYRSMKKTNDYREDLWDNTSATKSSNMTKQFRNLKAVILAYQMPESALYQQRDVYEEIVSGMEHLYKVFSYNGNQSVFEGNWWDYQIGSAKAITDSLILLADYLPHERLEALVHVVESYVPNAVDQMSKKGDIATGANRTDLAMSLLGTALLREDVSKLERLQNDLVPLFELATSEDGIYEDGSMVQHKTIPYTGGYGSVYLEGVSSLLTLLQPSPWKLDESTYQTLFPVLERGFISMLHEGQLMAMVQGRGMSRAPELMKSSSAYGGGFSMLGNLLFVSEIAPDLFRDKVESVTALWYPKIEKAINPLEHVRDMKHAEQITKALNTQSDPVELEKKVSIFSAMDRVAVHHDRYTLGLSMYSDRIANFESFSGENGKGWYTGDGMYYLYTHDDRQFGVSYWPTVNPYRLPGVTLDTRELALSSGERLLSPQSFVGGVEQGSNGTAVMNLDKSNFNQQDLTAQKSYLFLNDKVVLMGSKIQGNSPDTIETIFENRIIDTRIGDQFSVNGKTMTDSQQEMTVTPNMWAHYESKQHDDAIGYVFLEEAPITFEYETRKGTYQSINTLFGNDKQYENDFISIRQNHSSKADNDTYAVMILPQYSQAETKSLSQANPIHIMRNDASMHAVYDTDQQIIAVNVFEEDQLSLDFDGLPIKQLNLKPGSYVFHYENGNLTVSVSDPSQSVDTVDVEIVLKDKDIMMRSASDVKSLTFYLNPKNGQTRTQTVELVKGDNNGNGGITPEKPEVKPEEKPGETTNEKPETKPGDNKPGIGDELTNSKTDASNDDSHLPSTGRASDLPGFVFLMIGMGLVMLFESRRKRQS